MGFDSAWNWIASVASDAGGAVGDAIATAGDWIKDAAASTGSAISDGWSTLNNWFESFVDEGSEFYSDAYETTKDYLTGQYDKAYDYYPINQDRLDAYVQSMYDLGNKYTSGGDSTVEIETETIIDKVKKIIDKVDIDLGDPLSNIFSAVMGIWQTIDSLKDLFDSFINVDEEKLIQGAVDMAKLQKKITERLSQEIE